MTAPAITRPAALGPRTHAPATPALVDPARLSLFELRVVLYAANYRPTYDEMISPTAGIMRLTALATITANRLGIEVIRDIAAILEYAHLHHDNHLAARFCPDTVRWSFTESSALTYRRHLTRSRLPLHRIDTLARRYAGEPQAVAA